MNDLIAKLKAPSSQVRLSAVNELGSRFFRKSPAIDAFISALKDPAENVRDKAFNWLTEALSSFGSENNFAVCARAVEQLSILAKEADKDLRSNAIFLLGTTRSPQAVDALAKALGDSDEDIADRAVNALGQNTRQKSR